MTDKEKLEKIKALADKMYSRMAYLTSDTRPIRQAMDEYHQFIINEYHKEEPVSEDLDFIATRKALAYVNNINRGESPWLDSDMELAYEDGMKAGANWQKQQLMAKSVDAQCFGFQDAALFSFRLPSDKYLVGSEVKVIVIKQE